ncbi:MAG: transposase domain-containing protein [Anaerolineae bacterium]|nr:transposase domain-containing protein [Anaerolineae bacterium]
MTQHIPLARIKEAVVECQAQERRTRKLPATLVVLLCIGMNLFAHDSLGYVLLRLISDAICDFQLLDPVDHPRLWQRLLRDIVAFKLPEREDRINLRVVKRKMSNFTLKRPAHWNPPKPTQSFREAVVLLPNTSPAGVLN